MTQRIRRLGAQGRDLLAQPVHVLGQRLGTGGHASSGPAASAEGDCEGDDGEGEGGDVHAPSLGAGREPRGEGIQRVHLGGACAAWAPRSHRLPPES
ncbi:hypothetical protein GCM10009606_40780 [Nocardioides aquiterrae]|uniref:Uncharacterized protein n=1 Tax=Nocardioides aquiterrae TaxID=203799 RepID=A0ABN1UMM5_9ACTN